MLSARSASRISPADDTVRKILAPDHRLRVPTPPVGAQTQWLGAALGQPGSSRFVEVDGARIHYLVWGEQHPDRPVLVLAHGLRAHAHWWDAIAPGFSASYRVIAPDFSGMGDSDHRQEYVDPVYARDLIGVLEHEHASSVTMIGHSYGGSRVIQACALRPELFERLVLIDTFVAFDDDVLPEDSSRRSHSVYPEMAQAISRFRLLPEQPVINRQCLEHVARHSLRPVTGGLSWKFDPNVPPVRQREGNVSQMVGEIAVPVDYVYGEHSAIVDEARAHRIVKAFRAGRGPVEIPNAYHHVMLDQPMALVSALRALLAEGS